MAGKWPEEAIPLNPQWCNAVVALVCVALAVESAQGCDVPVFRYALERWRSDVYVATVFHRGELSERDADAVATFRTQSILEEGTANLEVRSCDVSLPLEPRHVELWNEQPPDAPLPRVVLQSPVVKGRRFVVWAGGLGEFDSALVFDSPGSARVVKRLFAGDSVVWLVCTSEGEASTEKVALLTRELDRLGNELPLPDGIGLPGSEVYSDVPLTLRFSVVPVRSGDPQERFVEAVLRAFAPAATADEPIVVPVYGRGRALAVLPLAEVDVPLIEDLSRFLSGPCSCQVKEQNPGFDLPLAVDWDGRLFPDSAPPADTHTGTRTKSRLVPISVSGPTRRTRAAESNPAAVLAPAARGVSPSGERRRTAQLLAIAAVTAGGLILAWSLRQWRGPRIDDRQQ